MFCYIYGCSGNLTFITLGLKGKGYASFPLLSVMLQQGRVIDWLSAQPPFMEFDATVLVKETISPSHVLVYFDAAGISQPFVIWAIQSHFYALQCCSHLK